MYWKYLKYSIEKMRDKEETLYKELIKINDYIRVKDIYKALLPVDVYGIYLIFKDIKKIYLYILIKTLTEKRHFFKTIAFFYIFCYHIIEEKDIF